MISPSLGMGGAHRLRDSELLWLIGNVVELFPSFSDPVSVTCFEPPVLSLIIIMLLVVNSSQDKVLSES